MTIAMCCCSKSSVPISIQQPYTPVRFSAQETEMDCCSGIVALALLALGILCVSQGLATNNKFQVAVGSLCVAAVTAACVYQVTFTVKSYLDENRYYNRSLRV